MIKKITIGIGALLIGLIGFLSKDHPIILKWLTGSARIIGQPIEAEVFTDGQLNSQIKVFPAQSAWLESDEIAYLILYFPHQKQAESRQVLCIHLGESYVAMPNSHKKDYDLVLGRLLESETGGKTMVSFQDGAKSFGFDPQLRVQEKRITFQLPPSLEDYNCDSIRIEL